MGLILGDHSYRCHQSREIGFRHGLRTNFPRVVLAGEAVSHDKPEIAQSAVYKLLSDHPGIGALYNAAGGNNGVVEANAKVGRTLDILTIAHEVNHVTVPLLLDGRIDYLLAQDPRELMREAVRQVDKSRTVRLATEALIDFGVFTKCNVPSYGKAFLT